MRRKTHEEFMQEMNIKHPNIQVLGTYKNNCTKILFRCKICGYEWEATANNLLHAKGCPQCNKNNRTKTHKQFIQEFYKYNTHAHDIELLNTYVNSSTKILCKCKLDGYEWETRPPRKNSYIFSMLFEKD